MEHREEELPSRVNGIGSPRIEDVKASLISSSAKRRTAELAAILERVSKGGRLLSTGPHPVSF